MPYVGVSSPLIGFSPFKDDMLLGRVRASSNSTSLTYLLPPFFPNDLAQQAAKQQMIARSRITAGRANLKHSTFDPQSVSGDKIPLVVSYSRMVGDGVGI